MHLLQLERGGAGQVLLHRQPKARFRLSWNLLEDEPGANHLGRSLARGRRFGHRRRAKGGAGARVNGLQIGELGGARHRQPSLASAGLDEGRAAHRGSISLESCDNHGRSARGYLKLRDRLLAGISRRGRLPETSARRENWDLFFGAFSETHCAGHQFWHFQDPAHPAYDQDAPTVSRRRFETSIRQWTWNWAGRSTR